MIDDKSAPGSWAKATPSLPCESKVEGKGGGSILDKLTSFEPSPDRDRWWAERWIKSATPAERQAMRELLA